MPERLRLFVAGDAFFGLYLILVWVFCRGLTPERLRRRAATEDEGIALIVLVTLGAIGVIAVALVTLINSKHDLGSLGLTLAIASVPLGWLTLHLNMAFHYANLFYADADPDPVKRRDSGGLEFPETPEPGIGEFIYQSFVIGMTAQVSDVQVLTSRMRRAVTVHGVVSFFFNTVILALAVNVAAQR